MRIMLTMSHLYPCKQAYNGRHSVISCNNIYLMLGFIVTITVIYVMPLLPSFEELAILSCLFGLPYEIYSGGGPSTYVYCVVCYCVIVAPYVRSVAHVFAYLYTLDDDSECPMDYETSLLPKVFPLYVYHMQILIDSHILPYWNLLTYTYSWHN